MTTETIDIEVIEMEELVNKLATLQAETESIVDQIAGDKLIQEHVTAIAKLEKQTSDGRDALHDLVSAYGQDLIDERMKEIKDQIIDEWNGDKKTLKYPAGTLSFRQTDSLRIIDDVRLMELLIEKAPIFDVVSKYIKGFKLTNVKKFVEVHNVQTGVASMEYKTTVKLERK